MQLSLTPVTLLFTLTVLSSSSPLLHPRQATLNLPNSLCAFNPDSINDHTIDAQCDIGSAIVSSKIALQKCITNSFGQLKFLTPGGFSITCDKCTLDRTMLDFSCACDDSAISPNAVSPNDNGIFGI